MAGGVRTRKRTSSRTHTGDKATRFVKPMLARIHPDAFDDPDWIFEIKWDGYRAIAEVDAGVVSLYSRNGLSFADRYPVVVQALKKIKDNVILDGEIVVLNEKNKPDFQKLQQYEALPGSTIIFYVFDCLAFNGRSLMDLPLLERKQILKKLLPRNRTVKYADHVAESGVAFFEQIVDLNLEGMIAKRASSRYHPGKRTGDWLKIKHHNHEEAVIAGYTAPRGSRQYFGALILGVYRNGKLEYVGHTGTGFNASALKSVYEKLQPLRRDSSPFHDKVPVNAPVTWVEPRLVCAIKYTEVTADGYLRHPVFIGLRDDKSAREVGPFAGRKKS